MNTPALSLSTPTELIAALPNLLGFVPVDDVVALMLGPAASPTHVAMHVAIRFPITIESEYAQQFPEMCHLDADQCPGAILVAVYAPQNDEHARDVLHTMRAALHRHGILVHRMLITHSVTTAGRWVDIDTGQRGPTMPYTDSPATTVGVLEGRVIAASREDMQREFATTEPAPVLDLEAQDFPALIADTAADLHRAITGNATATADLASRAALLVTAHVGLRDALLRLAVGHELAAGRLWTQIAAQHHGRTRAELLTMAAIAYYCGEDAVRAGMALTHAEAATCDDDTALPPLAAMAYTALQRGIPPAQIRELIPNQDKAPLPGTEL
jgi:Domain of unknown function (DUF4192)